VTLGHVQSVAEVVQDVLRAGAIDDGTGEMTPWQDLSPEKKAALIQVNVDEVTFERHQRHRGHLDRASARKTEPEIPPAVVSAAHLAMGGGATATGSRIDLPTNAENARLLVIPAQNDAARCVTMVLDSHHRGMIRDAVVIIPTRLMGASWSAALLDHVLCFVTPNPNAGQEGLTVAYLGSGESTFIEAFRPLGRVLKRIDG
jgi:hypothetical protein